jgi:arylsulfatase A-like enzyme
MYVSLEIIWISALFDLLLFGVLGFGLATVTRFFPRLSIIPSSVFLFSFLAFLDWLAVALTEHIHLYALLTLAVGLAVQFTRWFTKHEAATLRFWRRSLPAVAAVALLALLGIQGGLWMRERMAIAALPEASPGSLNILVIVVDALRGDHLSSHGYARPTSPNIDRIAQEGVLFENAVAASSWTSPSHASLLTGRHPSDHRVDWNTPRALLDSRHPTLAEALRSRGYRTAAFSANVFWFTRSMGFGRGFIRFEDFFHTIGDMAVRTLYGRTIEKLVLPRLGFEDIPARKRADDVNRSALRWIAHDRGKPFFVFLNYMDTHDPYLPPQPYRRKFAKLKNPGGILNWRVGRKYPQMTPEQLQGEIDAYDGAIAYVDDQIGQLFTDLHERDLAENTLVVITSDHGESFGEHGLFLHANALYRQEIRVPLIFWAPKRLPAGVRVVQPVTNVALPATVMDILSVGDERRFPSQSLAYFWKAPHANPDSPFPLAELAHIPWAPKKAPASRGSMKSLVSPEWHYIVHEKLGTELYDWKNDPRELHNLAKRSEMQSVVALFESQLFKAASNGKNSEGGVRR